jgi:hypothetical protein
MLGNHDGTELWVPLSPVGRTCTGTPNAATDTRVNT